MRDAKLADCGESRRVLKKLGDMEASRGRDVGSLSVSLAVEYWAAKDDNGSDLCIIIRRRLSRRQGHGVRVFCDAKLVTFSREAALVAQLMRWGKREPYPVGSGVPAKV